MDLYYSYYTSGGEKRIMIHNGKKMIKNFPITLKLNPGAYRSKLGNAQWKKDIEIFNKAKPKVLNKDMDYIDESMLTENFEKIYQKYSKKDYWFTQSVMKRKIDWWKELVDKGDSSAKRYTEADIKKAFMDDEKKKAKIMYDEMKKMIQQKNISGLKSRLRHDQKFSIECFEDITGKKLPKTTKTIHDFLDEFLNENRIELNEGGFFRKELEVTALDSEARLLPQLLKKYNAGKPRYAQVKMTVKKIGKTDTKGVNMYKATIESENMDVIDKFVNAMKGTKQALK